MKQLITLGLCVGTLASAQAQLTITDSLTVGEVATLLEGIGVTVSNVTVNCSANAMAHFSGSSEMGITEGLMLTNGNAAAVAGPSTDWASGMNNGAGDADIDAALGMPGITFDACGLEFDCVPQGDTLLFNFSFGSEEYPEYVNSAFNDAFAIYLSGPGFTPPSNVAALPGGTIVSINNVNSGLNPDYFHDNENPVGPNVAYDGFTTNLTVFAVVVPGETYHFKVVVADVADGVFDSGVFLEAFSFRSPVHATSMSDPRPATMFLSQIGNDLSVQVPADAVHGQQVLVLDATGSVVRTELLTGSTMRFDTNSLSQGLYFVKVLDSKLKPARFVKN